jgi:hypothetical protein
MAHRTDPGVAGRLPPVEGGCVFRWPSTDLLPLSAPGAAPASVTSTTQPRRTCVRTEAPPSAFPQVKAPVRHSCNSVGLD